MSRPRLNSSAHTELSRLERYAESTTGAAALLEVVNAWLTTSYRDADALRRAVDCYRRAEIRRTSDAVWVTRHQRGIGTLVALVDGGRGAVGAIDLRHFPRNKIAGR